MLARKAKTPRGHNIKIKLQTVDTITAGNNIKGINHTSKTQVAARAAYNANTLTGGTNEPANFGRVFRDRWASSCSVHKPGLTIKFSIIKMNPIASPKPKPPNPSHQLGCINFVLNRQRGNKALIINAALQARSRAIAGR
ncbi:MAG: hypothetical protein ACK419_03465 [Pyrinomonadaceae bacterium]